MSEMRQYAERLNRADPKRFDLVDDEFGDIFWDGDRCFTDLAIWELWGPLAEEFGVMALSRFTPEQFRKENAHTWGDPCGAGPPPALTLLEALAEAVCLKVEAKAKGEGKE